MGSGGGHGGTDLDYGKRASSVLKLESCKAKLLYKVNSFRYLPGGKYERGALGERAPWPANQRRFFDDFREV